MRTRRHFRCDSWPDELIFHHCNSLSSFCSADTETSKPVIPGSKNAKVEPNKENTHNESFAIVQGTASESGKAFDLSTAVENCTHITAEHGGTSTGVSLSAVKNVLNY